MIKCFKDEFDSAHLKRQVYKLVVEGVTSKEVVTRALAQEKIEILFAFIDFDNRNIEICEDLGFRLITTRLTYARDISKITFSTASPSEIQILKRSEFPKLFTIDIFNDITVAIAQTSRYWKDSRITKEEAISIYRAWVENTLFHDYADEVFVAIHNELPVGLLTFRHHDNNGIIDLFGVAPSQQGRGIGQALLKRGFEYLKSKKLLSCSVVTEAENIKANVFYQRGGFASQKLGLVYHKHYR